MPVTEKWAYFDHAAVGPIPRNSATAMRNWAEQASEDGDVPWPTWSAQAGKLRVLASSLLHCQPQEIALVPNTTFGINVVAAGYRWKPGDSVVLLANEFPSNLLPWVALEKRGVDVRQVAVDSTGVVDMTALDAAVDRTTRIVSVSWVGYASGLRLDLARVCEMAHARGAQLFVDAIQGLGVFPLSVDEIPIDYAAADGHKWMLGPEGCGILYIREKNLEYLEPLMLGWSSIEASHQFQSQGAIIKQTASRYEGGSPNHVGQIGLCQSLGLLMDLGCHEPENSIANAVLDNADEIESRLASVGACVFRPRHLDRQRHSMSGIVSFVLDGHDPVKVRKSLLDGGIVLSVRHDRLRVATHAYNNREDIDRLVERVREISRRS
jgi:selenocysteine lyase/cysteine desulfurase